MMTPLDLMSMRFQDAQQFKLYQKTAQDGITLDKMPHYGKK
jgi:hypothetical protein